MSTKSPKNRPNFSSLADQERVAPAPLIPPDRASLYGNRTLAAPEGIPSLPVPRPESIVEPVGEEASELPLDAKVPYNTLITKGTYIRLVQHDYWNREDMTTAVENALQLYLGRFPDADKPLPPHEHQKRLNVKKLQGRPRAKKSSR